MPLIATNQFNMGSGEVLVGAAVSVQGMLPTGVTLSGTPTLTITPSNAPDPTPTATSPAVSVIALTIFSIVVPAGEAIQYTLTGNSAAKGCYTLAWTCGGTDGSTYQGTGTFRIT